MGYLYRHIRLDTQEVFYIGISLLDDNKYSRAYNKYGRNKLWKSITAKTDYEVHIMLEGLTEEETFSKEIEFIEIYGRRDLGTGTLANLTSGGEGSFKRIKSDEERRKIRERMLGESNPMYGKKITKEQSERRSKARKGKRLGAESHRYGKKASEETRLKMSIALKGKRRGENTLRSKLVLNIETGIFYASAQEAYDYLNYKFSKEYFTAMLRGVSPNRTPFIYA